MPKVNKTQYAILGILSISPMSGYDIKKFIEISIGYFWNENFGHIYPVLKRLKSEGLVTKHIEEADLRPNRNVYTITDKGKETLSQWLSEDPQNTPYRDEMLFKLFFGVNVSVEENIRRILTEKEKNIKRLKEFDLIEEDLRNSIESKDCKVDANRLKYQLMTVLKGRYISKGNILWCDECLELLSKMEGSRG